MVLVTAPLIICKFAKWRRQRRPIINLRLETIPQPANSQTPLAYDKESKIQYKRCLWHQKSIATRYIFWTCFAHFAKGIISRTSGIIWKNEHNLSIIWAKNGHCKQHNKLSLLAKSIKAYKHAEANLVRWPLLQASQRKPKRNSENTIGFKFTLLFVAQKLRLNRKQ